MEKRQICPGCQSPEVKKIAYGFPANDFDFDKYEIGGCCVTGRDSKYKCIKCESSW